MTDEQIYRRLRLIPGFVTLVERVYNEIVELGATFVVVRSSRTGRNRTITFAELRQPFPTWNGCAIEALRCLLGLDEREFYQQASA